MPGHDKLNPLFSDQPATSLRGLCRELREQSDAVLQMATCRHDEKPLDRPALRALAGLSPNETRQPHSDVATAPNPAVAMPAR